MSPSAGDHISAAPRRQIFSVANVFLCLKALNLVVITAYSFEMIYVLVRILTIDLYPIAVLISSIGVYIMATDLGYSGFVYYRTRQSFLTQAAPHGSEAEVFILYTSIAGIAALGVALVLAFLGHIPVDVRIGLSLYFLSIVLALPWGLLRKIAAAVDLYVSFEVFELVRRLFFFGTAACMLAGLPLIGFTLICLLAWVVAFVMSIRMLQRRRQMVLVRSSAAAVLLHLRSNYRNIIHSGSLTLSEFVIYNFPYLMIPFVFTDKGFIVAFDIFYKVTRFGSVSYGVAAETFLPSQTRAFHSKDRAQVLRYYRIVALLGLIPLSISLTVLFGFGDQLFTKLLSRGGMIDASLRVAMGVMLTAMLFQTSAGTFLVGSGNYERLSRLAFVTLSLMGAVVVATWAAHISFGHFMYSYVAVYSLHAMFYTVYLFYFVRGLDARDLLPQAARP
jgi:hypothetical protein